MNSCALMITVLTILYNLWFHTRNHVAYHTWGEPEQAPHDGYYEKITCTYLKVTIFLQVLLFDISADWPKMQNFVLASISYIRICQSCTIFIYKIIVLVHSVFKPRSQKNVPENNCHLKVCMYVCVCVCVCVWWYFVHVFITQVH